MSKSSGSQKRAKNLTLSPGVIGLAEELMKARHYTKMTPLIEELIRDEYERRIAKLEINSPRKKAGRLSPAQKRLAQLAERIRSEPPSGVQSP